MSVLFRNDSEERSCGKIANIEEDDKEITAWAKWRELKLRASAKIFNFGCEPLSPAVAKGNEIHQQIEEHMKRTCAVCKKSNIPSEHYDRSFCSSDCAKKAAAAFAFEEQAIGRTIRGKSSTVTFVPAANTAAKRTLAFFSTLNLQDHPLREQQEAREIVHLLMQALENNEKVGR